MNTIYKCQRILLGMAVISGISVYASDNQLVLQPVLIMKASYGRIQSIQAMMDLCTWQTISEGQTTRTEKNCSMVEYRRVKERIYCQSTKPVISSDGTQAPDQRVIAAFDGTNSKLLRNVAGRDHFRAQRMPGTLLVEQITYSPDMMIGGISFPDWDAIDQNMDKVVVSTDPDTGWMILDYPAFDDEKAPRFRIWIDREKDFFPVRRESRLFDGTLALKEECRGLKQVDGFWVPTEFILDVPGAGVRSTCLIKEIKINRQIAPTMLDFDYPDKTIVSDDVTGTRYVIDRRKSQLSSGGSVSLTNNAQVPISDEALSASAGKGDELLRQAINIKQQPLRPKLSPAYVWVFPGENQYTLELAQETKTKPVLSGKTISDSPLILRGVDDQLASSGKLIVTLERPMDHKDFADAVLTLDFGMTKTPIHFVAAPLP